MPQPFVHLNPDIERACRDALVLTTTERLRRNLQTAYAEAMRKAGHLAWPTPRVRTVDGFLASRHAELVTTDPEAPRLLSDEAEFELFRATAPEDGERLIGLAREAWQICHQWRIPMTSEHLAATENGRLFLDWYDRALA